VADIDTQFFKISVQAPSAEKKEIFMAWMNFHGVDSIIEGADNMLEAYTKSDPKEMVILLSESCELPETAFTTEKVKNRNWNAEWEANFKPIEVGPVYIRAPFHKASKDSDKIDLIISPKMAFGTGHHETTYMMIEVMSQIDFTDKTILDYGCGTGILSVYAAMRGAINISANDIQKEAIENCHDQVELNGLSKKIFDFRVGRLEVFKGMTFDIILANINRHILLERATALKEQLNEGGSLLMSGILDRDRKLILETYKEAGFTMVDERQRGEWCCFLLDC